MASLSTSTWRQACPAIYAAGDVANAFHPLYGSPHPPRALVGRPQPGPGGGQGTCWANRPCTTRCPTFSPTSTTSGWSTGAWRPAWDEVVFRGDPSGREFIAFWLHGDRFVAGMNANVWDAGDTIEALVRARQAVDRARLADAEVDLSSLVAPTRG